MVGDIGWVDLVWDVPPSCPVTQPILPNPHLPRQNLADSGMTKIQPTSRTTIVTLFVPPEVRSTVLFVGLKEGGHRSHLGIYACSEYNATALFVRSKCDLLSSNTMMISSIDCISMVF